MIYVFWICLVGSVFSYLIYPAVVLVFARGQKEQERADTALPAVSLIIAAYNEESRLAQKLDNSLAIEYPSDKLEIIVASDGATDSTDLIAKGYAEQGIRLVTSDERKGKEHAQFAAIKVAQGDILVFSDVSTTIPLDGLLRVVDEFAEPSVGAVSSEDRFQSGGKPAGEGIYVKYEMWLRGIESRGAGLVGLSGSFFAARREVCRQWDVGSPSDFGVALNCVREGYKAISSPFVLGYYPNIKDERLEYSRKIRTILRGMTGLRRNLDVLNPFRYKFFAFQVFGHKLMRWAVPWFLIGLLTSSAWLSSGSLFFAAVLALQLAFYGLALLGSKFEIFRKGWLLKIPYFFTLVNLATLYATVRFVRGEQQLYWQPSER